MKFSKLKWKWIKFWGHRYITMFPDKSKKEYILYHRRFYEINLWDKYFAESKHI